MNKERGSLHKSKLGIKGIIYSWQIPKHVYRSSAWAVLKSQISDGRKLQWHFPHTPSAFTHRPKEGFLSYLWPSAEKTLAFSWSWVLEFLNLTVTLSNSTHSKRTFLLPLGSRCQDLNYTIKQCQCIFTSVFFFFSPLPPLPTLIFFPLSLSYAHFETEYHYSGKTDLGYELLTEASPRVENVCLHHHTCHDINVC